MEICQISETHLWIFFALSGRTGRYRYPYPRILPKVAKSPDKSQDKGILWCKSPDKSQEGYIRGEQISAQIPGHISRQIPGHISRQIPGHDLRNRSSREATRLILFLIYLNYTSISILQLFVYSSLAATQLSINSQSFSSVQQRVRFLSPFHPLLPLLFSCNVRNTYPWWKGCCPLGSFPPAFLSASVSAVSRDDAVLAVLYQLDVLVLGDASSSNIPVQVPPAPVLMRVMGRCAQY